MSDGWSWEGKENLYKQYSCSGEMAAITYTYDEFLDHFRAMVHVLKYDTARLDYSNYDKFFQIGDDKSFEVNVLRILDYFTQLDYSDEEKHYKGPRLMLVLDYIHEHLTYFDKQKFAVIGAKDGPSLIAEPLLHALYEYFCGDKLPRKNITPAQIVVKAKEFKAKDEENEKTPPL